jgi:hypothetical protein
MKRLALPLLIALNAALPAHADEAELRARIDQLSAELDSLKQEMRAMRSQNEAIANQQEAAAKSAPVATNTANTANTAHVASAAAVGAAPASQSQTLASLIEPLSIWGYGEINYNRPEHDNNETQMDLRRAVFGFGYRFDENTRFMSEYEVEHAVASAEDDGEVEVEQFYIDHKLTDYANLDAGLFLIPMGLLNESHEPTNYYGVERNFVETAIIPTTWREGGLALFGSTDMGIAWNVGVTTGFDLAKWDFSADGEGKESPLGSIHQELQNAQAKDLSQYASIKYVGIPGLVAGASVFTGKDSQGDPAIRVASDSRVTLWEAHTRWTPGNLDLSTLYSKGTISDTADLNAQNIGSPNLIPKEFWGWYAQAAYKFSLDGNSSIAPFTRFERFNTAADYATLPAGLTPESSPNETVWTYGINYYLNPNVVFKADYQNFSEASESNRFDLGMGLAF